MPDLCEEKTAAAHIGVASQGGARLVWDSASAGPVLAIETSCDETAVAVLAPDGAVLVERVLSQFADHAPFGGVVPEIAARAHLSHLPAMAREALAAASLTPGDLAAVAATSGPGLIGGLLVGAGFGKGLALAAGCPFIAVNHLEGHALTARLPGLVPGGIEFPYLLLLLSGGHCQCVAVEGVGRYRRLGGTIDDAVGEAFDKVAKLLGLGVPGGPAVERMAAAGDGRRYAFPRPLMGRAGCDFSFSGLKTAVAQLVATLPAGPIAPALCADIAASFQAAVAEVLADRAAQALAMMPSATRLVVAGGVAANATIRRALAGVAERRGLGLVAPPLRYCGDNAVMIGWAAIERLGHGLAAEGLDTRPQPRWPLDAEGVASHAENVTLKLPV
jgi:N6-L-threonylcarbamoyladenine synthase